MRGSPCLVALLVLTVLAGCADTPVAEVTDAADPEAPADINATVNTTAPLAPLAITNLTASALHGMVPFDVDFFFNGTGNGTWSLDVDGDGTAEANGSQLPGNHTHTFTQAGNHTANLTLTDGASVVSATLQIVAGVGDTVPEGGRLTSTTAGATAQALIGRTPFDMTQAHGQLDIVVVLDDPAASELGESYTVRLTPPSGGNNDYTTTNGETIVIEEPEVGTWEIGVFMVAAGYYEWTADYCGYTNTPCS